MEIGLKKVENAGETALMGKNSQGILPQEISKEPLGDQENTATFLSSQG